METAIEANATLADNFEWQNSAIDLVADNTAVPASEVTGDRYVLTFGGGAPNAAWDGASAGDVVEFNGTAWDAVTPTLGMMISIDDETTSLRQFGGATWDQKFFESTTASTGLTKSGFDIQLADAAAANGISVSSGAISAEVDDVGIEIATNVLALKDSGITDAKLRDSTALTVIGRSVNSTGAVADISAGTDNFVLRRSGTTLGFGLLVNANIDAAAAIVGTKIDPDFGSQNIQTSGLMVQGASANTVEIQYLHNATLTGGATDTVQADLTFDTTAFKSCIVEYTIVDTTSEDRRSGMLIINADNADAVASVLSDIVDLSGETGAGPGVSWDLNQSGDDLQISYTTTDNNKTMNARIIRFKA